MLTQAPVPRNVVYMNTTWNLRSDQAHVDALVRRYWAAVAAQLDAQYGEL
jgi:hypothetical protein